MARTELPHRPARTLAALLVCAAAAALTLAPGGGVAVAQDSGQAGGGDVPSVNSWALSPGGTTPGQPAPGSRPNLSYEVSPGDVINDSVSIFNYGNVQLTFGVYATDAFNNAAGNFDLLPGAQPPKDVGTWIHLPQANVTVAARTRLDLPITIDVPKGTSPGDHAGAILAASQVQATDSSGRVVNLDRRAGSRVYIRVAGALDPRLVVDDVHAVYGGRLLDPLKGRLELTYRVRNTGNLRLTAHQHLEVKAPFGLELGDKAAPDIGELLPGNSVTLHARFDDVAATVRVTGEITVTPSGGAPAGARLVAAVGGASTWAIPWMVVAVLVAAWIVRKLYRRRRPEPGQLALVDPTPTGDGSGVVAVR